MPPWPDSSRTEGRPVGGAGGGWVAPRPEPLSLVFARGAPTGGEAARSVGTIEAGRYADLLLFSPIFEKVDAKSVIQGVGLSALSQAVATAKAVPVLALGGVTAQNARHCLAAGAAGVAAIRLFMGEGWISLVD